jgi:DNA gyrase subunit A
MATNVPPHNLREVIDGCIWLIENTHLRRRGRAPITRARSCAADSPDPAPDFPTGGYIVGRQAPCRPTRPARLDPDAREVEIETNKKGDRSRSSSPRFPIRSTRRS